MWQSGMLGTCPRHQDWSLTWCLRLSAPQEPCTSASHGPRLTNPVFLGAFCEDVVFLTAFFFSRWNQKKGNPQSMEGSLRLEVKFKFCYPLFYLSLSFLELCKSSPLPGKWCCRLSAVTPFNFYISASSSFTNACNLVVFGDIFMWQVSKRSIFFLSGDILATNI